MLKMAFAWLVLSVLFSSSNAAEIELLNCEPPDLPVWGGYGPQKTYYMPGDVVHYFCDVDTYIGGNFYRKCLDTGGWNGETPVCDAPIAFKGQVHQSSNMADNSLASAAIDGMRTTCSETIGTERDEWWGNFTQSGELIRVMLFFPKGPQNIEVIVTKGNGDEIVCGRISKTIDRYDWLIQNCPGKNTHGATGLKLRSLTTDPLRICELQAHVLTTPTCSDPHYRIENGRLRLTRKTATLVCDKEYARSKDFRLDCVRDGEWNRKTLYCIEREWEVDNTEPRDYESPFDGPLTERRRNPQADRQRSA